MTETEWDACTDPTPMLEFLHGKASERKLRLYLCGGCQRIAHLFFSPESLAAIEIAERFADGQASAEELHRAEWDAESPTFGYDFDEGFWEMETTRPRKQVVICRLVELGALTESALNGGEWLMNVGVRGELLAAAVLAESCACYDLREGVPNWALRAIPSIKWPSRWLCDCVFGNPFHPVCLDHSWLALTDGAIPKMAKVIYADRAFAHLPLLADALEEAGCDSREILDHCRSGGEHVRGCWVVDLLLGKS